MNKPITLCDRCKEYARCCLNYDGDNCRRSRTVEPTNADRIRSMTDEELADFMAEFMYCVKCWKFDKEQGICTRTSGCNSAMLNWLKEEV